MSKEEPLVSVNIPTYNSGRTLDKCLKSIVNQTYRNIEIIVIDSYSRDRTLEIAKRYGAKIYFGRSTDLAQRRGIGVKKSLGKYILLLDSDQVLEPDVITKCVEECEKKRYDMITLFERSIIKKATLIERIIAYDKWLFHSQRDDDPIYGAAIPRFFRAEVLKKVSWPRGLITFDHSVIHYEAIKTGAKAGFMDVYIYHHEPSSLTQVIRKFYYYGFYYVPALRRNKKLVISHSLPRRVYFSKKAFKDPRLYIGLFLLYIVKGLAALAGVLAYFLM